MKLYKALKLKKHLLGEINKIKEQITNNNSYLTGSVNSENTDVIGLNTKLMAKINELVGLKFAINVANTEIHDKIFVMSEYKALISFWNGVSVNEGLTKASQYVEKVYDYKVHINEITRDNMVHEYQQKVDALQEEIDMYNYVTDIPWDEIPAEPAEAVEVVKE